MTETINYFPFFLSSFISFLLAVVFPIVLIILWRKKTRASLRYLLTGAAIFVVFAMGLEQLLHIAVGAFAPFILQNAGPYVIYGCLAAGLFEETGRLLAFKMLKKNRKPENAVMYGIGHGGVESVLIAGVSFTYQLVILAVLALGGVDAVIAMLGDVNADVTLKSLAAASPLLGLAGGIERFSAIIFHISMSVVVFYGMKTGQTVKYWIIAVLSHAFLNVFAALYQVALMGSIWLVEGLVFVVAMAAAYYAFTLYRKVRALDDVEAGLTAAALEE